VKPTSQVRLSSLTKTANFIANACHRYASHIDESAAAEISNCRTEQADFSDRRPVFAGITRDICGVQVNDKINALCF